MHNTPRSQQPHRPEVHESTAADVERLGHTFARAFATDPVWDFICGTRMPRFEQLAPAFFGAETRLHIPERLAVSSTDGKAGALWSPPGNWKAGFSDALALAPGAIRLFTWRLASALKMLSEVERVHPSEPHWYLALLGTDPDFQGRGYGSAVLAPMLERCDTEGTPAYLESSKEANVPFYERHGFEVTDTIDLAKGRGPRMWLMWREPSAERTTD